MLERPLAEEKDLKSWSRYFGRAAETVLRVRCGAEEVQWPRPLVMQLHPMTAGPLTLMLAELPQMKWTRRRRRLQLSVDGEDSRMDAN